MTILLLLLSQLAFASPSASFRGSVEVEQVLSERLLADSQDFAFAPYLTESGNAAAAGNLLLLLGQYSSRGGNEFRNGTPNAVNMLVWRLVLQLTAEETKKYCAGQTSLVFHSYFRASLDGLCRWPSPEAKSESLLRAFWLSVMSEDAPESEYVAWREFALTSSVASLPAAEALPQLFFAIVYNPYFLLRN